MADSIAPEIFRQYDIRGVVGDTLTEDSMRRIGRAYGTYIQTQTGPTIVTGRDLRPSSEMLQAALIEGLVAAGCHVINVGRAPTPVIYYAIGQFCGDGGVIVTASHNPVQYNGVKSRKLDRPLFGDELAKVRDIACAGEFRQGSGSVEEREILPSYMDCVMGKFALGGRFHVVIDAGNGAAALTAEQVLSQIGAKVTTLYCTPDGSIPREPDPTKRGALEDLKARVLAGGADLGVAFDPDGDRLQVLDHTGAGMSCDLTVLPICRDVLSRGSRTIVSEVRCSQTLIDDVRNHGGVFHMTACGYPYILQGMAERGGSIGTETSGHCYFDDPDIRFDDAVYAACRLIQALLASGKTMRQHVVDAPEYHSTPEERWHCEEKAKFAIVQSAIDRFLALGLDAITLDGIRLQYPDGWGLVRASNTGPELTMRFEGRTPEARDRIRDEMQGALRGVMDGVQS